MLAAAVQLFSAADIIGKIQKGAEFIVRFRHSIRLSFKLELLK
jgi:hypothetical protein